MRHVVTMVDACVRDDRGGSPTGVVADHADLDDADRTRLASLVGASHTAFVGAHARADGGHEVRFFTAEGELTGCGHGTVGAQAVLLLRSGAAEYRGPQHTGPRSAQVVARRAQTGADVQFDQGLVALSGAAEPALLGALGVSDIGVVVASPGAPRLLVPVVDAAALRSVRPDLVRLRDGCRRAGLLGCFVFVPPNRTEPIPARMFAPAIGVPEDVANANSTGCLAAHLLATRDLSEIRCHQGDQLGRPCTVVAAAERDAGGIRTRVGGRAIVRADLTIRL